MFIRETFTTIKGKQYRQHKLIESIRTQAGPRQKVILYMGNKINVPKENWKELADSIEAEYHKQKAMFPVDPKIKRIAKYYATLIQQNELNQQFNTEQDRSLSPNYETVDLNSLEHSQVKTIGSEQVILSQIREYGFHQLLKKHKFNSKQIKLAEALIIARAAHPASERETARWLNTSSGTKELLGIEKNIYDNALHRVAHLLMDSKTKIETELAQKAKEHFKLKEQIILYDLTNTFFAGSKRQSKLALPGKSKERRNDRPLVSIALRIDEKGFPKGSEILEGNVSEPKTLENVLKKLKQQEPLLIQEKTIVIDAGIATDDNLKLIQKYGFHYVAVSRRHSFPEDFWLKSKEQTIQLPSNKKNPLKVKLVKTDTEAFLLCKSKAKELKASAILKKRQKKFIEELNNLNTGLSKPRRLKQYDQVLQKIGSLKERYKVGNLYTIEVAQKVEAQGSGQAKVFATAITFKQNKQGQAKTEGLGEYVIRTDRLDLNEQDISQLHRSLTTVEASFRSLKSELGLRPNYHKLDRNMQAHIFITILTYHILAAIISKLEEANIYLEWKTIRNILANYVRVTSSFKSKDNQIIHIRGTSVANLDQIKIYNALNIKRDLLGKQKAKILSIFPESPQM